MSDTSGPSSRTPLAFYDPDSCCWRTSQGTFLSDSTPSSLTLPASGMTHGGALYELPTLAPATDGPGSSLLPTPAAFESDPTEEFVEEMRETFDPEARMYLPGRKWHSQRTLSRVAAMLPTPSAADGMGGHERRGGDRGDELLLAGLAKTLLPTPTTQPGTGNGHARNLGKEARMLPTPQGRDGDHTRGADPERYKGSKSQNGRRSNLDDMIAAKEAGRFLPTPTRRDHKGHNQRHDETCPTGALTAPQSPATPPRSDDPHPTLWTDEDG